MSEKTNTATVPNPKKDLLVRVKEIQGNCPVYKIGDAFWIHDGFRLEVPAGQTVCLHGLSSLMPFYRTLAAGIPPRQVGLACGDGRAACVQCPDAARFTGGGTVTFEVLPVEKVPEIQTLEI